MHSPDAFISTAKRCLYNHPAQRFPSHTHRTQSESHQCPARVDIESLRSERWKEKSDSLFRGVKSENLSHPFREAKSEMKMPRYWDEGVRFFENSHEVYVLKIFERGVIVILWRGVIKSPFFPPLALECIAVRQILHTSSFFENTSKIRAVFNKNTSKIRAKIRVKLKFLF